MIIDILHDRGSTHRPCIEATVKFSCSQRCSVLTSAGVEVCCCLNSCHTLETNTHAPHTPYTALYVLHLGIERPEIGYVVLLSATTRVVAAVVVMRAARVCFQVREKTRSKKICPKTLEKWERFLDQIYFAHPSLFGLLHHVIQMMMTMTMMTISRSSPVYENRRFRSASCLANHSSAPGFEVVGGLIHAHCEGMTSSHTFNLLHACIVTAGMCRHRDSTPSPRDLTVKK